MSKEIREAQKLIDKACSKKLQKPDIQLFQ